jgi:hypothetical protein
MDRVYFTDGLLDVLLELAAERDPQEFSVPLQVSQVADLEPVSELGPDQDGPDDPELLNPDMQGSDGLEPLDPELPVFTDFYFPSQGRAVDAVFGVDVTVPHGQTQGRFIAHPKGIDSVSMEDDLHEILVVAVPPWTRESVKTYDRSGRQIRLVTLSGAPSTPAFEG